MERAQQRWVNAATDEPLYQLKDKLPDCEAEAVAMLALADVSEALVLPIFARTDAIGTVMRRKLEPVTAPLLQQFQVLRRAAR